MLDGYWGLSPALGINDLLLNGRNNVLHGIRARNCCSGGCTVLKAQVLMKGCDA
jgi:hypothetical protein